MMSFMPKKKGPKGPTQISMRLKPAELGPLDEDRKALPGVPVSRNTYAKHAVLSFPKLRRLEEVLRQHASTLHEDARPSSQYASIVLREAGL
jgi:hypothetical protein